MKRIAPLVLFCVLFQFANAQQRPHYTQYIMNNYIINPAVAGIENLKKLKLNHPPQWVFLDCGEDGYFQFLVTLTALKDHLALYESRGQSEQLHLLPQFQSA